MMLEDQTVVVIGGSAGIGLATARLAATQGADVILTGRDEDRLKHAAADVGAIRIAAFDVGDGARLDDFFASLPGRVDQVLVTAGRPYYAPLAGLDFDDAGRYLSSHLLMPLRVGRAAVGRVRPGGSAPPCRSAAWSAPTTSPRWPCT